MTVRVIWIPRASEELLEISAYLDQFDSAVAERLIAEIRRKTDSLADFPRKGRLIRPGVRQLTGAHPYLIRYRIKGGVIEITRVYHGARNVRSPRPGYVAESAAA